MTFGNNKRSFGQRSVKRKKQDFHKHKIKPSEEEPKDLTSLKERTMVSLVHLGEQRFSLEPGGYSFGNWMNNFNLLLDDFESQVGTENLPKSYFEKRFELTSSLAKSKLAASDLDLEISKLREEQQKLVQDITRARDRQRNEAEVRERKERIRLLENEKRETIEQLEKAKYQIAERRKQTEDSSKLIRRLFGTSKSTDQTSLQTLESRVKEAEFKMGVIEKKILEQRKRIEPYEEGEIEIPKISTASTLDDLEKRYNSLSQNLEELETEKAERSEMLEERKQTTMQMKDTIASLEFPLVSSSTQP